MSLNRRLELALLFSLIIHALILAQNPDFRFNPLHKQDKKIEISYIKETKKAPELRKPAQKQAASRAQGLSKDPFLNLNSKIAMEKRTPPPFVTQKAKVAFPKPDFSKTNALSYKKKITLPAVDMEKMNNPTYLSYYQMIREKIKRAAYQNISHNETGEVFISFIVSDDGYLKQVRLIEDKSSPDLALREAALKSIKDASPFPNFHKELDYPQLSFNVVISCELE